EGGAIVAEGTPAQLAHAPGSHTATFLRRYFPAAESNNGSAASHEAVNVGAANGQPKKSARRRSATVLQ
ncbi:MAG TPA: hypothetical protein VE109_07300, partial [Acidobacteriaceae bacterium]|nr:hypothetical protein [Acidobacteriaceae bacterium]